ncbi:MAG: NTP transferase domain-containing protein [Nevskiaceae bacterium]|jgi:molybdopterin-guanine dinucleotide biosynthesis protein A|nr:NTP transferase domain-containing protein [Nevskiaceae bacterium]
MSAAPLRALVLAGGRSTRMGRDKAALEYGGQSQLERAVALLQAVVDAVHVSVRADQADDPLRARFHRIVDRGDVQGPIAGIRAAQSQHPDAAWLVVACDLPHLNEATLRELIARRDPAKTATAYRSSHDGLPEPLCAIWEPDSASLLQRFIDGGRNCPRKFLINSDTLLLDQPNPEALDNVNTPDELAAARERLAGAKAAPRPLRVQYFALLREQAGTREEQIQTSATTPAELYRELAARHRFTLEPSMLKVAVNAQFRDWTQPLAANDTVVFIPPVAGG